MSYNKFNNGFSYYSPYFHQSNGQDTRGQGPYQNSEAGPSQYQNQGYPSLNYQNNQHQTSYRPPVTPAGRSASYINSRDGDLSTGDQVQESKGNYNYSTSRPPVDTTALGNLAYASSLSHEARSPPTPSDNPSLQQIINFNRSRTSQVYSSHSSYEPGTGNSYQQQQSGSYRTTGSPENQTGKGSNSQLPQTSNINSHNRLQSEPQISHQNTHGDRRSSQPYYFQAPRPSSGQSHGEPQSRPNNQASHPPLKQPYQPANSVNGSPNNSSQGFSSQQYARPPQQPHASNQNVLQPSSQSTEINGWKDETQPVTQPAALGGGSNSQSPQTFRREPQEDSATDNQAPTTVDPSQVFNHYEYQRRHAAAAAVAAKQTKEAKQATEARQTAEAAAALNYVSNAGAPKSSAAESNKEAEIAAEMRMMIEKMREYKSKDPSLFSQIWGQVKKVSLLSVESIKLLM
ncbi:MAG: hypothetical protein LQ342_004386 [Letrouitia transgressa]|nr:MAG: hypothetical protein LQ342_004386 [Letrouitia transgressa]